MLAIGPREFATHLDQPSFAAPKRRAMLLGLRRQIGLRLFVGEPDSEDSNLAAASNSVKSRSSRAPRLCVARRKLRLKRGDLIGEPMRQRECIRQVWPRDRLLR